MKGESFLMFLAGALAGGAVAIMVAPEKGSVTREKLKEMFEKEFGDKMCHCNEPAGKGGLMDE